MSRLDGPTWNLLAPLLDRALELEGAERERYVREALRDRSELQELLYELIEAEARAGDFLEEPARLHAGILVDVPTDAPLPTIPGYTILREIGHGGMGVVYEALRAGEEYEQRVAVKVLRPEAAQGTLRARFARERRILAGLEHPGIARLIDGGDTADGRAYFALEYVEGRPITEFADAERLTIAQRLRLFEQVCAAVAFAQQRLIVHRDLKPGNILVTADGQVKLLDFGIARLLGVEAGDAPGLTQDLSRLLTPEYAAPEQLRGEAVTTATDVYALGILLYELLSGRHPHGSTREQSLEHLLRGSESTWLPDSLVGERSVVQADGSLRVVDLAAVCAARRVDARRLRRLLRGDLASITARALQRDAPQRYASADALLAELERHRRGEPVHAQAPTWRYRLRKFVARRRVPITAAALVLLALLGGLGTALWQARVAAREAARSSWMNDFLVSLFEDAAPELSGGQDWTASQLLERGAERLADAREGDPTVRRQLQQTLGKIHVSRGEYEQASALLQAALSDAPTQQRAGILVNLANAALYALRLDDADSLLAELESMPRLMPEDRLGLLAGRAALQQRRGHYAAAESLHREVLALDRRRLPAQHRELANDLDNVAVVVADQGRLEEAEALHREALQMRRALLVAPHPEIALSLHNLAELLQRRGQLDESIELFREAIAARRLLYLGKHPQLAGSLRGLGMALQARGDLEESEQLLEEALAMSRELLGESNQEVASAINELAINAYHRDDLPRARELFTESLAMFERVLGPAHPTTLSIASNLATVQSMTGQLTEAEATYRKVLERRREVYGDEHPSVAFTLNSIGLVLRRRGDFTASAEHHRAALERYRAALGDEHNDVAGTRCHLASALRELGELAESQQLYEAALAAREQQLPAGHRDIADARLGLARTIAARGDFARALPIAQQAEAELIALYGEDSARTAIASSTHGECLARLGQPAEGRVLVQRAYELLLARSGPEDSETRALRRLLASLPR